MSSEATLAELYAKIAARLKASQSLSRNQNSLTGVLQGSEERSEQVQRPYNNNQNQAWHPTLHPINAVLTQQGRYAQQPQVLNEDISETTSVTRKRGYEEHVFDLCGTPWQSSFKRSKPMRRGILSSSTQENIANVKKAGGACWRCKMLKKPCDGATPCKQCENNNGALWDIECIRGSLQIPYDHWDGSTKLLSCGRWLCHRGSDYFPEYVTINSSEKPCIRDLPLPITEPSSSILNCLNLFRNFDRQYKLFSSAFNHFIFQSVRIQEDIIFRQPSPKAYIGEDNILIYLSLRMLALSLERFHVGNIEYYSHTPITRDMETGQQVENCFHFLGSGRINAKYFKTMPANGRAREIDAEKEDQFFLLVNHVISLIGRLLFLRKAVYFPVVFCALGILSRTWPFIDNRLVPVYGIRLRIRTFCRFYISCAKGCHPFHYNQVQTLAQYSQWVKGDQMSVNYFTWLQEPWHEYMKSAGSLEDFPQEEESLEHKFNLAFG